MRHLRRFGQVRSSAFRSVAALSAVLAAAGIATAATPAAAATKRSAPAAQRLKVLPHTTLAMAEPSPASHPTSASRGDASWPAASSTAITVAGSSATTAQHGQRAGSSPIYLAALAGTSTRSAAAGGVTGSTQLDVQVVSHSAAVKAHVAGVLFQLERRAASDAGLAVSLDYSGFANAGGAEFGQRLHLVSMPACALTTPAVPACQVQTPVAATNDGKAQTLTATLAAAPSAQPQSARSLAAQSKPVTAALASATGSSTVLAAVAGASGPSGTFTASSLAPSGSWSVSGASGSFNWSYPITLPPAAAGSGVAPSVALSYDSGSVDGRIASTNDQSSWIGGGWDYSPGYIERTYRTCADDTTLPTASQTGDECWAGQIVTMNLSGSSTALVYDDSTQTWHPQTDDGARVELVGASTTSGYQGEYWRVTTTDGVQYYFGKDTLPGGTAATNTNATWTEPVFGAHSGDPCYSSAGFAQSSCQQAWRWNLDYVVDPHGNATSYSYLPETNYYGQDNKTTATTAADQYVRGGTLAEIDYGLRAEGATPNIYATPAPERVKFTVAERCFPSGTITCAPSQFTAANANSWPDTPQDQQCLVGAVCNNHSPTFWSTKRLTTITTSIHTTGTSYQTIDSYALGQAFSGGADDELDLNSITRTATASDNSSSITLPAVTFSYGYLANRVYGFNAQPQMLHERLSQIVTETGETITVDYEQAGRSPAPCTATTVPSDPSNDTTECFPVYWTPPYNSTPILDYFHKYVVTEVDLHDHNAISPDRDTTYTYLGGAAWHYDDNEVVKPKNRTYGQFRGYAQVQTRTGNPNSTSNGVADAWTLSTTTYYRGMDGDTLPGGQTRSASVVDSLNESVTDSDQFADSVREVQTFNGDTANQISTTITTLNTNAVTASRARTGLPALIATQVDTSVSRTFTTLAAGGTRETQNAYGYDSAGRKIQESDTGTGVAPLCTTTHYADNTTSWIRDQVDEVIKSAQTCPAYTATPSPILSDVQSYYDGATSLGTITGPGDATQVDTETTAGHWAVTTSTYDQDGRPTGSIVYATATDPRPTSIAYTPADGGPIIKTVTTNALNQTTTTIVDPGRGSTLETTDVANHTTDASYDALGRLTSLWLPGHVKGTNPATSTYSYIYGPNAPLAVTTKTLVDPGNGATPGYVTSISLYDGFGTLRQTQSDAVGTGRVVTDTYTDSHGWTIGTANEWVTTGSPATSIVTTAQSAIDDATQTTYDGAGRPVQVTAVKDGTATWSTKTIYSGDRTTTIPPTGGVESTAVTDARGNTIEQDQWTSPPTISGNLISGGTATKTTYSFDPLNRQTQMVSPAGGTGAPTWTTSYDLAGRTITQVDPDTGTTHSSYDDAGELISTTDALGQTLAYAYDDLGRKTGEYLGSVSAANQQAGWLYDTLQPGQLTSSTRYTSAGNYTTTATGYDGAGRPLGSTLSLPASVTGFASSYTTSQTWTSTGLMASLTPAPGGSLPVEKIIYTYDNHGDLTSEGGATYPVSASVYNQLGQPTRYTLGVNNQTAWLNTTYDVQTHRVTNLLLSSQSSAIPQLENEAYSYDASGNPTKTVDTQGGGTGAPTETTCYTYNALDQLNQAWSATDNCAANPSTANSNATVGGAQPYWTSWSFDANGDRASQTQHALPGATGGDTTTTYINGVTTPTTQAHALASTATTGPAGNSTTSDTYDADGNTSTVTQPTGNQTFTYTPEGNTNTITTTAGTVSYTYDADNNQLLRADPTTTTLYLPGEELARDNTSGTITGTRYYTYNGSVIGERVGHSNPQYVFSDLHGTSQTVVPTTQTGTSTPTRRYFDPYGNSLAATTGGTWPDQHAFLNKPTDPTTGLDDVGARTYNPTTGRFLTADPLLNANDPQSINGYGYADNNPETGSDPTGKYLTTGDNGNNPAFDAGSDSDSTASEQTAQGRDGCGSENACQHDNGGGSDSGGCDSCQTYIQLGPHVIISSSDPRVTKFVAAYNKFSHSASWWKAFDKQPEDFQANGILMQWLDVCGENKGLCSQSLKVALFGLMSSLGMDSINHQGPTNLADTDIIFGNDGAGDFTISGFAFDSAAADSDSDPADSLSDETLVVRGGAEQALSPEGLADRIGTHPSGHTGWSAQSREGASLEDLCECIPNGQVGVTTVGAIRGKGGDVVVTAGRGYHVTITDISPEDLGPLLDIQPNPLR